MTMTVAKSELREAMKGFSAFFRSQAKKEKCLVRLRDSGGVLTLTASDGDNWLTFRKPVNSDSDAFTDIVLPWAVLKRFNARSQSGNLSFIEISGVPGDISVSDSIGSERHSRVPLSEWPEAPCPPKAFTCVDEKFFETLAKVAPFAADDSGVREAQKGVLIEPNWLVASDHKRLVRFPVETGLKESVVIARHGLLASGVLQGDGDIGVNAETHRIVIRTAAWIFDAPEIQATYPNYKALVLNRKPFTKSVTFTQKSAEKLIQALSRKAVSHAVDPICFLFDSENSLVAYRDGKNAVEVEIETTGEIDTVITLNHPIPLEMLRLGLRTIRFDNPQAIMMAVGDGKGDMTLMPLANSYGNAVREVGLRHQREREAKLQPNNQPITQPTNNEQPKQEESPMSEQQTRPSEQPKPTAENQGFKVIGSEKSTVTFEELIEYVNSVRLEAARLRDMVNALPTKIRDAHRSVKEKEREYENARMVINRLRKVSGF